MERLYHSARGLLCLAMGGFAALLTTMAMETASAQESGVGPLEEIVVSARRREESMQSVPISVSAFTGEEMSLRNMETGRDLSAMVPNLVMGAGSLGQEQSALRMRGIPGVGIYVDGVWQGNLGVLEANLLDMQRVEVLRGPQGTLFGRNTNGGAIQYVTETPGPEYSGNVQLSLGDFERRDAKATLNIPLASRLYTKWTAARYQHDGYLKSVSSYDESGTAYDNRNDTVLRGDLLWEPTDSFSMRFTAFDARQNGTEGRQVRFSFQPGAEWFTNAHLKALNWLMQQPGRQFPAAAFDPAHYEAGWPGGEVGLWETKAKQPADALVNNSRDQTLTFNWNITDALALESITAHRTQYVHQLSLQDAADFVACCRDDRHYDEELVSQEFHLTGDAANGKIGFLAGLYYSDANNKARLYRWWMTNWYLPDADGDGNPELNTALLDQVHAYGASVGDPALANYAPLGFWVNNNHQWTQDNQQERAVFGELDWNLSDRLQLTFGARWSWRDVVTDTYRPGSGDAPALFLSPAILSPTEEGGIGPGNMWGGTLVPPSVPGINEVHLSAEFTPKLSLSYNWSDDGMFYFTYAEGFSEGGVEYVSELDQLITLVPEVVSSYEAGIKSDLLDRSLRFNADVFFSKWDGLRVTRHPPDPNNPGQELPTPYTTSDGAAEVKGAEAEIIWFPTDQLSFNFSGGWLKTKYTDIGDPNAASQTLAFGARFAFAPTWSYSIGTQYDVSLSNQGNLTVRVDYGWQGDYERDPSVTRHRLKPEPAYGLLNLRTRYTSSANWSISLWGKNLTNEHYVDGGFVSAGLGFSLDTVGPPREYGVTVDVDF
jgi:iron complex outermembrane receptor protein